VAHERDGPPEPQYVTVAEPSHSVNCVFVHERAVARQTVVVQGELTGMPLDHGVQRGHLIVPVEAQIGRRVAADGQLGALRPEADDQLLAARTPIDEERLPTRSAWMTAWSSRALRGRGPSPLPPPMTIVALIPQNPVAG
jgi:hypothetical protein